MDKAQLFKCGMASEGEWAFVLRYDSTGSAHRRRKQKSLDVQRRWARCIEATVDSVSTVIVVAGRANTHTRI